jgi:hypothetical protein
MSSQMASTKHLFSGPGLLFVPSRITSIDVSDSTYNRWYSEVHVPDVLKTGAVSHAARWGRLDPSNPNPYLALYQIKDLKLCLGDKFKAIPATHELLGGVESYNDVAHMDARYYSLVEVSEKVIYDAGQYFVFTDPLTLGLTC